LVVILTGFSMYNMQKIYLFKVNILPIGENKDIASEYKGKSLGLLTAKGISVGDTVKISTTTSDTEFTAILISENISAHKQRVIYYCNNAICLETATEYLLIHGQLFLLAHFISVNIIYE